MKIGPRFAERVLSTFPGSAVGLKEIFTSGAPSALERFLNEQRPGAQSLELARAGLRAVPENQSVEGDAFRETCQQVITANLLYWRYLEIRDRSREAGEDHTVLDIENPPCDAVPAPEQI